VGKGTTIERFKIIQRSVFFKAGNLLSGAEIPARPEICFQGRKFHPYGPEFPPLDKISGGRKFRFGRISGGQKL
jgi:hypothetical protein